MRARGCPRARVESREKRVLREVILRGPAVDGIAGVFYFPAFVALDEDGIVADDGSGFAFGFDDVGAIGGVGVPGFEAIGGAGVDVDGLAIVELGVVVLDEGGDDVSGDGAVGDVVVDVAGDAGDGAGGGILPDIPGGEGSGGAGGAGLGIGAVVVGDIEVVLGDGGVEIGGGVGLGGVDHE